MKSQAVLIFEYLHYRAYLQASLGVGRTGKRQALARFMGCPASHISQVLKEKTHLTLEQGERVSRFLQLSAAESRYLLNMIGFERAGTQELKAHFRQLLNQGRQEQLSVSGRLQAQSDIPEDAKSRYYSSWIYLAVHLAVQVPRLRTREAVAQYLNLEPARVSEALDFLMTHGFVMMTKDGLSAGPFHLFLGKDSPHLNSHHMNWRAKAMEKIGARDEESLHYSSAFTVSRSAALKIKQNILDLIEANVNLIKDAQDEEVYAFTADFFALPWKI